MFQLCYIDAFTNSVNHTQAKVVNKVLYYPAVKGHVHIAHTPGVAHAQAQLQVVYDTRLDIL
jgi:hypothetical protein